MHIAARDDGPGIDERSCAPSSAATTARPRARASGSSARAADGRVRDRVEAGEGTRVAVVKWLPPLEATRPARASPMLRELLAEDDDSALEELARQNRDLVAVLTSWRRSASARATQRDARRVEPRAERGQRQLRELSAMKEDSSRSPRTTCARR
jgi:hypothetical protein